MSCVCVILMYSNLSPEITVYFPLGPLHHNVFIYKLHASYFTAWILMTIDGYNGQNSLSGNAKQPKQLNNSLKDEGAQPKYHLQLKFPLLEFFRNNIAFFPSRHFYNLHTLTATIICLLRTKNCWWWKITGSIFGAHALLGAVTREYLNSQEIFGSTALAVVQLWQYLQYLLYRKIFGSFAAA